MMNLIDLPLEVLDLIFQKIECEWGWKNVTVSYRKEFVATCRKLYNLFTPKIFSEFEFDPSSRLDIAFGYERPFLFARSLLGKPHLAEHLRTLSLTRWDNLFDYEPHYRTLFPSTSEGSKFSDRLGKVLLPLNSNIRNLDLDYPTGCTFLNRPFSELRRATIRPTPGISTCGKVVFPLAGSLSVAFLPKLLLSPRLICVNVSSVNIEDDDVLHEMVMKARSSSVKVLKMSVGNFEDKALLGLLKMPKALVEFEFLPTTDGDLRSNSGSDPANLPKISTIGECLRSQADSLQVVRLSRGNWYWNMKLDQIGSLRELRSLRELQVDASMLLGWNHCRHQRTDGQNLARSPEEIAEYLPDSIEMFDLGLDDYHWERNGSGYVLLIVQSLYANMARLRKLEQVTMKLGHMPYCDQCDSDIDMQTRRMKITRQEMQTVLGVVKMCRFKFIWGAIVEFGNEVDVGSVHQIAAEVELFEPAFDVSEANRAADVQW